MFRWLWGKRTLGRGNALQVRQIIDQLGIERCKSTSSLTQAYLSQNGARHGVSLYSDKRILWLSGHSRLVFERGCSPKNLLAVVARRNQQLNGIQWRFSSCWDRDSFTVETQLKGNAITSEQLHCSLLAIVNELERCRWLLAYCRANADKVSDFVRPN